MSNTVTLRADGRLFTGWTSVSVTRSIESVAGYFELGVNVPPGTDLSGLAPGKAFTLEIDGQIVCTG
ncbi:TPA: phage baseplate assembly protein, partial [Escherichia coli]